MSVDAARWAPLVDGGIIDDPWLDGAERLALEPEVLTTGETAGLAAAALAVAMMLDEAVPAVARDAALARDIGLDASLRAVAALDAPRWLCLARVDVFAVADGGPPQASEINCDTPTGLAECTELARLARIAHPALADPSARLRERWLAAVRACLPERGDGAVGIVDATEITEDLAHARLVTRWLEDDGLRVVRGAPFNLHGCPDGRVGLFGAPCDVLVRHYKTDWWARRRPAWRDEVPPPDRAPLARELGLVAAAQAAGKLAVINPWGAAIAQSKRALALPWERPALFSPEILADVARHLPETRFLESMPRALLERERERWVLKSAFGCEGAEVLVGSRTDARAWREALALAAPRQWIAQRAFAPRVDADGTSANRGVFLVGGAPSGLYTRRSAAPTDAAARSCPTLVRP